MNTNRNTGPAWAPDPEANSGKGEHVGSFLSMGRGYIHLHRSLTEWQWYTNERVKSVFLHLLIRCNWQDRKWMDMDIPAGSFVTSTVALASELGISRSALVRALDILKKSGEITVKADSQRTAITLTNWAKYQGEQDEAGQPKDSKRTTAGQRTDTTNKGKKENKGKNTPNGVSAETIVERRARFVAACRVVCDADKNRLPEKLRAEFLAYWTEPSAGGKMRFEGETYFDHGRRMDTWKANASKRGELTPAESGVSTGGWNPRA